MRYFTYHKDAGTSHCEKMRVGGPPPSFLTPVFNCLNSMVSQKQGKKECERSEIDHHPVWQFLFN